MHSDRHRTLLAMGIQPWYLRGSLLDEEVASNASVASADEQAVEAVPENNTANVTRQPIRFSWVATATGLIVYLGEDEMLVGFVRDVAMYCDWREPSDEARRAGEFAWPQLTSSTGTPQRALQAFFNKHIPGVSNAWVGVDGELLEELTPWIDALNLRVIQLPEIRRAMSNADVKRALWQRLRNLA